MTAIQKILLDEQESVQVGLLFGTHPDFIRQVLTLCQIPGLYWQQCTSWQEVIQKAMLTPPAVVVFQWDPEKRQTVPDQKTLEQLEGTDILAITSDLSQIRLEDVSEHINQVLELQWLPRFLPHLLRKSLHRQETWSDQRFIDFLTGLPSPLGISAQV